MPERETGRAPLMTIIITTVSGGGSMRVAIEHLKKQTVAGDLKIIILGPEGAWPDDMEENLGGFYGYEIMDVDLDNGLYDA